LDLIGSDTMTDSKLAEASEGMNVAQAIRSIEKLLGGMQPGLCGARDEAVQGCFLGEHQAVLRAVGRSRDADERQFPLLGDHLQYPDLQGSVPWAMIAPHADQGYTNHGQGLHAQAARGGLNCCELLWVLTDEGPSGAAVRVSEMPTVIAELSRRIALWRAAMR
jgi:hypothetical protein